MYDHDLVHVNCATEGCGHVICLREEVLERIKRNRETVRCPAGHGTWWPDEETPDRKKIRRLEKKISLLNRLVDRRGERVHELVSLVADLRRELRTCPVCGTRFRWRVDYRKRMAHHLEEAHGVELPVEETEAVEA